MRIIKGFIRTNRIGSECDFEFEVDESATEEEIEEVAREAAFELVEWNFTIEEQP